MDRRNMTLWFITILVAFTVGQVLRAEIVFDGDYRCLVAECRILKD